MMELFSTNLENPALVDDADYALVSSYPYKGVVFNKQCQKFQATIMVAKRRAHLGLFEKAEDAARAYDAAAKKLFGDFAVSSFPEFQKAA